jgi:hypothetical protein
MIISHKYRFIFIKTHKTAGSSVETMLSQLCAPNDIVSTMDPPAQDHEPRNWIGNSPLDKLYAKYERMRKLIHKDSVFLNKHYYQHMGGARIKQLCGDEIWNSYYKFCFDRNPWDKVVSFYWWKMRGKAQKTPFSEWLRVKKLPLDHQLYCFGDEVAVDFVGCYETLNQDLQKVLEHIGIENPPELPQVKTGIRKDKAHFSSVYDEADREFVAELFAREIELLGYDFEGKNQPTAWIKEP